MPHGEGDPFPKHFVIEVGALLARVVYLRVLVNILVVDVLKNKNKNKSEPVN